MKSINWYLRAARRRIGPRTTTVLVTGAAMITAVLSIPAVQQSPVGTIANTVADAPAQIVKSVEQVIDQQYLGFDTNIYPGDRAMTVWAKDGTYDWVGFYLEAPCHSDDSWKGKRDTLSGMGWGVAVVYVGQQAWSSKKKPKKGSTCATKNLSAANGARDGADAISKVIKEGFQPGSIIFLDIERMDRIPETMRAYYTAWAKAVLADGRYRPGFYAHTDNAQAIYADVKPVFVQAGDPADPPFWIAGNTRVFSVDKVPTDVGHTFAAVWQGVLDVTRTHAGVKLPIDINVASVRSPSNSP
jgi:hypothetical protein